MESVRAFIENIIYYNKDNYYAVLSASVGGEELTIVGHFPLIGAGETIEAEGRYTFHHIYGEQFEAQSFHVIEPEGAEEIERYLACGAVRGIGAKLAHRIVQSFGDDSFRIMEEEPEQLVMLKGISEAMALSFSSQLSEKRGMREAVIFMQRYGLSYHLASRIFDHYGPALYSVINSNPYRLAEDIDGVGFGTADRIALSMGIAPGDKYRIRCGLLYVLAESAGGGHSFMPAGELRERASMLLCIDPGDLTPILTDLQISGKIMIVEADDGDEESSEVYLSAYYYAEANIAHMLRSLDLRGESSPELTAQRIRRVEEEIGIELDCMQREAVAMSHENGVIIITGGPGTGKTTLINAIIRFYSGEEEHILLAAPTGRAAKRMTEASGVEAKTIHRLLEYTGIPTSGNAPGTTESYEGTDGGLGAAPYSGAGNAGGAGATSGKGRFLRDELNPLEADVLIIDEMSMVDIFLMEALLKAVVPGTRLILVGDVDQLPSVGPGNVLRDLIDSGFFPTVRLERIFRQAERSDIVINAHKINHGERVDLSAKSDNFLFIRTGTAEKTTDAIRILLSDKLPGFIGCDPMDIQVITASRKGELGVEKLNLLLQEYLNPFGTPGSDGRFRTGDKVMQIKNDYELGWKIYDHDRLVQEMGSGVFNGDIGRISEIDEDSGIVTVVFDDMREVEYDRKHLVHLDLAYALTVHKAQGCEYPAVVMPMFRAPRPLMNRNLLYTALTRARKCVVMVGLPQAFEEMERNEDEHKRYSGLKDRLSEVFGD